MHRLLELRRFFVDYKVLEGKAVTVETPLGPNEARAILQEAIDLYARDEDQLRRDES